MSTDTEHSLLDQLRAMQQAGVKEIKALRDGRIAARAEHAKVDPASLPDDDARAAHKAKYEADEAAYTARFDQMEAELRERDAEIKREAALDERVKDAERASAPDIRVGREPLTYMRENAHEVSYWADLAADHSEKCATAFRKRDMGGGQKAKERLKRHWQEMDVELPKRREARERSIRKEIEEAVEAELRAGHVSHRSNRAQRRALEARLEATWERRVNPSTTQGQGGYFDPPLWLVEDWIPYLRAGRTTADLCRHMDVPEGVVSVNIPKVTTPTLVGAQLANNVAVVSQDIADSSVSTGFHTYAGQEDVAIQWLDFAPGRITDEVVTSDLQAAYNLVLNHDVIQGTGTANSTTTSGQLAGLYPTTNWTSTAVTNTQGSPTAATMFGTWGVQASQLAQARFNLQNVHYVVHPRRGLWFVSGLDGASSKPFVESAGFAPFQPGAIEEMNVAEGRIATLPWGPGIYIDKSVPTTDNGSGSLTGTYDVSIAAKWDDVWLFESTPRARVLEEVLSGTLQVRFQLYAYAGLLVRYGTSITIAQGSGMAAPTVNSGSY